MKKKSALATLFCLFSMQTVFAADLLEIYSQALISDPTFQQAVAQRLSTKTGVPISVAALLPNLSFTGSPSVTRFSYSGSNYPTSGGYDLPRNNSQRAYTYSLTLTQTVFDFSQISAVTGAVALSKEADAILNAALQSLIVRVASAYFAILHDEDIVRYSVASKRAYREQLNQIKQQYQVGLKTITDLYTAQASYDSAVATNIAADTTLANDKENLRVITGIDYSQLSALSETFPLIRPSPSNINEWVATAQKQNWAIKAAQFNVQAARQMVRQQFAGHLPTVNVQGSLNKQYTDAINNFSPYALRNGPGTVSERQIALNVNIPLFSGGSVIAATHQATYNYQVAQQQSEQTLRTTINTTRQSYMNVVAGISQLTADKQVIKSTISSLDGLNQSYQVGTETLVDVLNQQQKVFQAQTQYATDRYAFINNFLALKQAAGTLSVNDLQVINRWLISGKRL